MLWYTQRDLDELRTVVDAAEHLAVSLRTVVSNINTQKMRNSTCMSDMAD